MPSDLYLTATGDLAVANTGDIAVTNSTAEFLRQQCSMRLATRLGDFVVYGRLGGDLQRLIGMPNIPQTARLGKQLILRTLTYDGLVSSQTPTVDATPTAPDKIEFEVKIPYGRREFINITLTQLLTV
jgi:hypothetical protein